MKFEEYLSEALTPSAARAKMVALARELKAAIEHEDAKTWGNLPAHNKQFMARDFERLKTAFEKLNDKKNAALAAQGIELCKIGAR